MGVDLESRGSWVVLLSLVLAGCAPRISAADAARLTPRVRAELERRPARPFHVVLPLQRGKDLAASLTASILATTGLTGTPVQASTLPELAGNRWTRAAAIPEKGPLFDPGDLLAAALVRRMASAGQLDPASAQCPGGADCGAAELTLTVEVTEVNLVVFPESPLSSLQRFEGLAVLSDRGQHELWRGRCELENLTPPVDPSQSRLERYQWTLDVGSVRCAEALAAQLTAAVSGAR